MFYEVPVYEFEKRFKETSFYETIELLAPYVNMTTKIKCRCKNCGYEWETTPNQLINGYGCLKCSYVERGKTRKKNLQERFEKRITENCPFYELLSDYNGYHGEVTVKCKNCGEIFEVTGASIYKKTRCPNCVKKEQEIREKAKINKEKYYTSKTFDEKFKVVKNKFKDLDLKVLNKEKGLIDVKCKVCGYVYDVDLYDLMKSKGCKQCTVTRVHEGQKIPFENFIKKAKEANPTIEIMSKYNTAHDAIKIKCNICNYEWELQSASKLYKKVQCPYCADKVVVKGKNDLATTHPHFIKFFKDFTDAEKVKFSSSCVKTFKCPDCGYEKDTIVSIVTRYGYNCPICGDKISFPNKLIRNILLMCRVDVLKTEYNASWAEGYRYDAYFEKDGVPYLVEMDGSFHYRSHYKQTGENNFKKRQEADKRKTELAKIQGIKLVRINCHNKTDEQIIEEVKNSELKNILPFNKIDWVECESKCTKNLIKEVCDYYNSFGGTKKELGNKFLISGETAAKYLRKGKKFGWTNGIPKQNKITKVYDLEGNLLKEFTSVSQCIKYMREFYQVNITNKDINNMNSGILKSYKGFIIKSEQVE